MLLNHVTSSPFFILWNLAGDGVLGAQGSDFRASLLQDRLTVSREAYPTIALAFRKIYRNHGVGGLYAGISPTLIGMLPYSTCYYFMYETIKKSYCQSKNKKALNRAELLLVGALSGQIIAVHVHHQKNETTTKKKKFIPSWVPPSERSWPDPLRRTDGEHHQLPAGGRQEAADGRVPAGAVPAQHGSGSAGGGQRGGLEGPLQGMGRQLPQGHAQLWDHLDVLRALEGHPARRQMPSLKTHLRNPILLAIIGPLFPEKAENRPTSARFSAEFLEAPILTTTWEELDEEEQ